MAISKSLFTRGLNQRVGGAVFYQQAGRTLVRELAAEVSNPRTISQMTQRVKWSNLVAFYKANKGWMKKAFESKKATQSDYNRFMSLNSSNARIAFTKQQAQVGACVVDAYRITEGSLPPVEVYDQGWGWESNIFLPINFEGVSVAELTTALLANNPTLRLGDQISFIRVTQQVSNSLGVPYIRVTAHEMRLDLENINRWDSYLPEDLIVANTGCLAVTNNEGTGAFAFVVSRTISGKTLVSTQSLTLVNMETYIDSYTSTSAYEKAIHSYGEATDVFLDSNNAYSVTGEEIALSILGVTITDTGEFIKANEEFRVTEENKTSTSKVKFNAPITGVNNCTVYYISGSNRMNRSVSATTSGDEVTIGLPGNVMTVGVYIAKIEIRTDTQIYSIVFDNPLGGDLE